MLVEGRGCVSGVVTSPTTSLFLFLPKPDCSFPGAPPRTAEALKHPLGLLGASVRTDPSALQTLLASGSPSLDLVPFLPSLLELLYIFFI